MFSFPAFSLAVCWLGVVHAQAHLCRKKDGWMACQSKRQHEG